MNGFRDIRADRWTHRHARRSKIFDWPPVVSEERSHAVSRSSAEATRLKLKLSTRGRRCENTPRSTLFSFSISHRYIVLGASSLDPSIGAYHAALSGHHSHSAGWTIASATLQTGRCKPIPVTTPCSQPLCAGFRSSVTHGIGSVTDIPEISCDLSI